MDSGPPNQDPSEPNSSQCGGSREETQSALQREQLCLKCTEECRIRFGDIVTVEPGQDFECEASKDRAGAMAEEARLTRPREDDADDDEAPMRKKARRFGEEKMKATALAIDSVISIPSRPAPGAPDPYHNYERPPGQPRRSNDSNQLFQLQVGLTRRLQREDERRKAQQAEKSQQADNFQYQQNLQGSQVQLPSPALDQTPQECILSTTGFASTDDFLNLSEADFDRWVMAQSQLSFCEDKFSTPPGPSAVAKALNTIPSISLTPASPTTSAIPASLTIVAPRPRYYHQVPKAWVGGPERTFEDYVVVARPDSSPVDITSQAKQDTYVQQDYTQPSNPTPHAIQDTILKESTSNPGMATQSTSQAGQQEQASSLLTPGTSRVIKRVTATFYIKEEEDDDTGLEYIDCLEDDVELDSTEGRSPTQGSASSHALSQVSTSSETLSSAPATPTSPILSFADIVIPSEEEAAAVLASFMAHVRKECEHTRTTNVTSPSFRDAFMAAVRVSMQQAIPDVDGKYEEDPLKRVALIMEPYRTVDGGYVGVDCKDIVRRFKAAGPESVDSFSVAMGVMYLSNIGLRWWEE